MESQQSSAAAQAAPGAQERQLAVDAAVSKAMDKWNLLSGPCKKDALKQLFKTELEAVHLLGAVQGLTAENQRLGAENERECAKNAALEHSLQQATADSVRHAQRVHDLSFKLTECNRTLKEYKEKAASHDADEAGIDIPDPDDTPATKMSLTYALGLIPGSASPDELMEGFTLVLQSHHLLEAQLRQEALWFFGQHGKAELQKKQEQERPKWESKSTEEQWSVFVDLWTRHIELRRLACEDRKQIAELQAQLKAVQAAAAATSQSIAAAKFQLPQYQELNGPHVEKCEIAGEEKVNGLLADLVAELKRTPQKVKEREVREKTVKAQVKKLTKLYAELRARLDKSHHVQHGVPTQPMQAAAMHGDSVDADHIALLDSTTWDRYSVKDLKRALVQYRISQQQAEQAMQNRQLELTEALEKLEELAPLRENFEAAVKEGRNQDFEDRVQIELNNILDKMNAPTPSKQMQELEVKLEDAQAQLLSLQGVQDRCVEFKAHATGADLLLEEQRKQAKAERKQAKAERDKVNDERDKVKGELAEAKAELAEVKAELAEVKAHAAQQTQQKISEAEGLYAVAQRKINEEHSKQLENVLHDLCQVKTQLVTTQQQLALKEALDRTVCSGLQSMHQDLGELAELAELAELGGLDSMFVEQEKALSISRKELEDCKVKHAAYFELQNDHKLHLERELARLTGVEQELMKCQEQLCLCKQALDIEVTHARQVFNQYHILNNAMIHTAALNVQNTNTMLQASIERETLRRQCMVGQDAQSMVAQFAAQSEHALNESTGQSADPAEQSAAHQ